MRVLMARLSVWFALLWGLCATILCANTIAAALDAHRLAEGAHFVALARLDPSATWTRMEWQAGDKEPPTPRNARLLPEADDRDFPARIERLGPGESRVTVSEGRLTRQTYRYRVNDEGRLLADAHQAAPTFLKLIALGIVCLLLAGVLAESFAESSPPAAMPAGWRALLAPMVWHRNITGTSREVWGSLKATGFLSRWRLGLPAGLLPPGAGADVRRVRLGRAARVKAGIAVPADVSAWRLIVRVWPHRTASLVFGVGLAVFPGAAIWTLGQLIALALGGLAVPSVLPEVALAACLAILAALGMRWAMRQDKAIPGGAAAAAITAAIDGIPLPDPGVRTGPPIMATPVELAIVALIIAILAAVAIPQYGNYLPRSFVGEAVTEARPVKAAIEAYRRLHGRWPTHWGELDPPVADPLAVKRDVLLRAGRDGTVEIHFPPNFAIRHFSGSVLLLVPTEKGDAVDWDHCHGLGLPLEYRPGRCRPAP